ncbi:hypothetical protein JB92DRAFT_2946109 [Gautieria morchelliformis]|nr:hypothetical protein JB92DRAFT_2946109 [Gautieria morchelliformis]
MRGIALSLLFISAATCSSSKHNILALARTTYACSLHHGTMEIQVNCSVTMEVQLKIGASTGEVSQSARPYGTGM